MGGETPPLSFLINKQIFSLDKACRKFGRREHICYGYKESNLSGFGCLFFTTASLKSLTMRQHSLVFCLAVVKNRLTKTAKHLSRRKFCANLLDIDAAWLTPSKEKSSKLAKNNKRETKRFDSLYPYVTELNFRHNAV